MKTGMFVLLTVLLWGGEARAFVDDYLCVRQMERAMKAHDHLIVQDAELKALNPYRLYVSSPVDTAIAIDGWTLSDGGSLYYKPAPIDTRTEDEKLDDEITAIEKRRTALHERRTKDAIWEAAKARNADQHTLAQRLWDEAKKNCWGKP